MKNRVRVRRPSLAMRLLPLGAAFCAGVLVDGWLRVHGPPQPSARSTGAVVSISPVDDAASEGSSQATGLSVRPLAPLSPAPAGPVAMTGSRPALQLPIDGLDVESMKGGFWERRAGHPHEAVDLLAARNTPVHAVDDGTIAKLFVSKAGGNTIYQFDRTSRLCYYYAHLERYADFLHEGDTVKRGQVIGFVGTSGNAPPNTPHLHFAVFELAADRHWWEGRAIDPYLVFTGAITGPR